MTKRPKISVLIPTYNSAHFLKEAIESIINQNFQNYELIVVDNNSIDDTEEVVKEYLNFPNFFFFKNEKNFGMGGNWNIALQHAKGDYIKFVCADDKLHPSNLRKLSEVLDKDCTITLVSSYFENFGLENNIIKHPFANKHEGKEVLEYNLFHYNAIGTPTQVMFRRDSIWIGTFRTELFWVLDSDMWLRILNIGNYFCITEVLSYVRCHESQGTVTANMNFSTVFDEYTYLKSAYLLKTFKINSNDAEFKEALNRKVINIIDKLPRMFITRKFNLINKAFCYAYDEKILVRSFFKLLKVSLASTLRRIGKVIK